RTVLADSQARLEQETALAGKIGELRARMEAARAEGQPAAEAAGADGAASADADAGDAEPVPAPAKKKARKSAKKSASVEEVKVSPEQTELDALMAELRALQGESPMVPLQVDGGVVAEIVSAWTGIPLGRMVKDEIRTVRNLGGL